MQGWVRVLPLLAAALVAAAPPAREAPWSLRDVVDFFNQGTRTAYLYRVVGAGALDARATPGQIQFMVKETECLKSEVKNIEDCKFQDGGAMKDCTARLPVDPKTDDIVIHCGSPVPKGARLVRRPPRRCGRRVGCLSSIGFSPIQVEFPSDLVTEDLQDNTPAEEIHETFHDTDLENKDLPIATENRSPGTEIHKQRGTRVVRGAPWRCGRRPGCFSSIGKVEEAPKEFEFPSDLVTEDLQDNTPAEVIHETFHDTDLDNEDFPIDTENRSPGAEIHKQSGTRVVRRPPWRCGRRAGCFSIIGRFGDTPKEVEFSLDLVTKDFQVNTPAEEIHDKFHDSDLDNEDLPIATENRSPGAEIHTKHHARARRARPWDCFRRGGCYSSIGHGRTAENLPQEPGWIHSPELDSSVLGSYDSDLDEKEIPHGLNMLLGDAMKSKESRNPYEVEWTWEDHDSR